MCRAHPPQVVQHAADTPSAAHASQRVSRPAPLYLLYPTPPLFYHPLQVVQHAADTLNVVDTCVATELLRTLLPHLLEQLELTQKSLSAYLGGWVGAHAGLPACS